MKFILKFVAVLALNLTLLSAHILAKDITEYSLKACAKIDNDLKRLACFDKVVKLMNKDIRIKVVDTKEVTTPQQQEIVTKTPELQKVQTQKEKTFGFEQKIIKESADTIESTIEGEFSGWTGKTVFHLANGQVWRQSQPGRLYHKATNPKVIIKKAAFGSYRLKVEGANARVYVKRIK